MVCLGLQKYRMVIAIGRLLYDTPMHRQKKKVYWVILFFKCGSGHRRSIRIMRVGIYSLWWSRYLSLNCRISWWKVLFELCTRILYIIHLSYLPRYTGPWARGGFWWLKPLPWMKKCQCFQKILYFPNIFLFTSLNQVCFFTQY